MYALRPPNTLFRERNPLAPSSGTGFPLFAAMFVIGSLAGSFVGAFYNGGDLFAAPSNSSPSFSDYIILLFENLRFHIIAILLSTSFLGVAALPLLSAARGYFISCAAAAVVSAYPDGGLALALCTLGLPLLVTLPFFFIISTDAFASSLRLLGFYRSAPVTNRPSGMRRHVAACTGCVSLWTLIQLFIMPRLVAALL